MKQLPVADPGAPDLRSAMRYLLWVARTQATTMWVAVALGIVWMVTQALMPAAVGRAIDELAGGDMSGLTRWSLVMLALGLVQTAAGIGRHRFAVTNWLGAAYRTVQVTVRQASRLGATLPKRVATGEVVSVGTSDIAQIGNAMDITARGAGALVALVTVTVIMLRTSLPLGLVVLVGVPVLMSVVGLLLRPLHTRQQAYRDLSGKLTGRATDIVAGLRVLRGVGGEAAFAARYRAQSQQVRNAGVRVARVDSVLQGFQILLPGSFVVLVTWLGARFALDGRITAGQLVAFYAYAAFLISPLRTLTEMADKITRGHVSARRVVRILALEPEIAEPAQPAVPPRGDTQLVDPESGVVIRPGLLAAIAAATPEEAAAIADRLGRYTESAARLSGVPLRQLATAAVREGILVADNDARLFSGPLRAEVDPRDTDDRDALAAALHTASAEDIIAALPDGLDTPVVERGREFSGGQQQRLRLVRALLADAPILVLVEPTSAVDAHTEARIAQRLGAARSGRTTVVCTTSPLLLDRADHVLYVEGGRVRAEGTHRELLDRSPAYAATVTRGEEL